MKRFGCPVCGSEIYFENDVCLTCKSLVAYDPVAEAFTTLPVETSPETARACANRAVIGCNWLVPPGPGTLCTACSHNRTIPDQSLPENVANWREIELAKRYLFYSLLCWGLPHPGRKANPKNGLAFDFLADTTDKDGKVKRVLTGHASGLITVNIAEGDDAEREARRTELGEPYRTLIGHMRHEIGHFYWDIIVRDAGRLDSFRAVFGDERESYADALKRHYKTGAPDDWQDAFISTYATAHPWEDFAETWAHYIHIVDASETAHAFAMTLHGDGVTVDINPYRSADFQEIIDDWVPITLAMNCLNRSMGQPDLYPFVLNDPVIEKLRWIHDLIEAAGSR